MKVLMNGKPMFDIADGHRTVTEIQQGVVQSQIDGFKAVDHAIDQVMQRTPETHAIHDWVTGIVDEGVHPMVEVTKSVGWAFGKGIWSAADYAGYLIYEKLPQHIQNVTHEAIIETVKNCAAGTGCF